MLSQQTLTNPFFWLILLLTLLGCGAAPTNTDPTNATPSTPISDSGTASDAETNPDHARFAQVQAEAGFPIYIPDLPADFRLISLNVTDTGAAPTAEAPHQDKMIVFEYQGDVGVLAFTQFMVPPEIGAIPPQGPDIRAINVGETAFPMREFTLQEVPTRHLYYERGLQQLSITTGIPPESLPDTELGAIANSLHPLE
jgi:hypothetical protein